MIVPSKKSITMILESILTCPYCNDEQPEELIENISPVNFRCKTCKEIVKISEGQCCIYCEYGDYPCLNAQVIGSACCSND